MIISRHQSMISVKANQYLSIIDTIENSTNIFCMFNCFCLFLSSSHLVPDHLLTRTFFTLSPLKLCSLCNRAGGSNSTADLTILNRHRLLPVDEILINRVSLFIFNTYMKFICMVNIYCKGGMLWVN